MRSANHIIPLEDNFQLVQLYNCPCDMNKKYDLSTQTVPGLKRAKYARVSDAWEIEILRLSVVGWTAAWQLLDWIAQLLNCCATNAYNLCQSAVVL